MLCVVTDKCSMGCTHCLSDCKPEGKHITPEQFMQNIKWCAPLMRVQPLLISGGEPFEHPDIKTLLAYALNFVKDRGYDTGAFQIIICTNGKPLLDDGDLYDWYKDLCTKESLISTQITNVPKYYPTVFTDDEWLKLLSIRGSYKCSNEDSIWLYPQGRALNLEKPRYVTKGPKCVNARIVAKQVIGRLDSIYDVYAFISTIKFKFCTPRINIDGSISLGESRLCPPIGTIDDDPKKLFNRLIECKCENCSIAVAELKSSSATAYSMFKS